MVMTVRGRTAIRFDRRWLDYRQVLEQGTPDSVGRIKPAPPDRRKEVVTALRGNTPEATEAADAALDEVWARDAQSWPRRLSKPFLHGLSAGAIDAFTLLVRAGCQPDRLAFQFHEAAQVKEHSKDQDQVRADLADLEKLTAEAVEAVRRLWTRRERFDKYIESRRLRAPEGESGDAELKILLADLEDLCARHQSDYERLKRRTDGRREGFLEHAEVRVSRQIHEVTGAYHDAKVELVIDELRQRLGHPWRSPGWLNKRRQRWTKSLAGLKLPNQWLKNEG